MRRRSIISTLLVALIISGSGWLDAPALGTTTVVTGDLHGTVSSIANTTLVLAVSDTSSGLRLLKGRSLKLRTDVKTRVQRNGKASKSSALKRGDAINARAKCTFVITNSSSKITCLAIRVFASAPADVPTSVEFTITGTVTIIDRVSFMMIADKVDADVNASAVAGSFDLRQPVSLAYDSRTIVLVDSATANFSDVSNAHPIRVSVICQATKPYNCRAWKILILMPEPLPVTLVGLVSLITPNSITIDVESVVNIQDAAVNVQLLRVQQLPITVPSGATVLRGTQPVALKSLGLGERLTVRAQCRLAVPFDCVASQVSARS